MAAKRAEIRESFSFFIQTKPGTLVVLEKYQIFTYNIDINKKEGIYMSNRQRIIELLNVIPDYKIGYVLAYVQGVAADEEADDLFCQRMVENYENAPDEDKENIPLEECLKEWGLD